MWCRGACVCKIAQVPTEYLSSSFLGKVWFWNFADIFSWNFRWLPHTHTHTPMLFSCSCEIETTVNAENVQNQLALTAVDKFQTFLTHQSCCCCCCCCWFHFLLCLKKRLPRFHPVLSLYTSLSSSVSHSLLFYLFVISPPSRFSTLTTATSGFSFLLLQALNVLLRYRNVSNIYNLSSFFFYP